MVILTIIIIIAVGALLMLMGTKGGPLSSNSLNNSNMNIRSLAFDHNQEIPSEYTCDGDNVSPVIIFSDIPEEAKSLALISHDPDADAKGGWTHWVAINMPTNVGRLPKNVKLTQGLETTTSFGTTGYGGPCPPSGTHRYFFNAYALDTMLDLDESATKKEIEKAMKGHILDEAELIGLYKRS